ncbi:hypothetical protein GUITHDRAFT_139393 [Guillardia theta CCMP2712]|uniref:Ionotropic glutamate receptor C-terminal domain-containing protein n=1 Tax=Guillardia theta (strain CCMP2712) TaxID=905079 RepID=L1J8W1_GUITC|nr:hypothetical protein GUITHDRAFT_139393 [Guillardia theta CCMP2712]EKX44757.1 hypothetical protein GUITHDRAFT_139393 [Guillardia theta CCMP2712]|eukprot:XP_005831737.1 hypothetical protein GUITHDRAFT_139393 [Guillardia theta CCMP2712]
MSLGGSTFCMLNYLLWMMLRPWEEGRSGPCLKVLHDSVRVHVLADELEHRVVVVAVHISAAYQVSGSVDLAEVEESEDLTGRDDEVGASSMRTLGGLAGEDVSDARLEYAGGGHHGAAISRGVLLLAHVYAATATLPAGWNTSHCGQKFRLITNQISPFVNVDPSKCQNQKCPAAAFKAGEEGFTYELVTTYLKQHLEAMCKDAKEKTVTFEWYLPPSNSNLESATNSFNILCNGDFTNTKLSSTTSACPALATYNGTSPNTANVCNGVGDSTCTSAGPDAVMACYLTVRQIVVRRSYFRWPDIMNTFKAFSLDLWMAILAEIFLVMVLILLVETWKNPAIEKSFNILTPIYDSLYHSSFMLIFWAFGSALCPGGQGKAACTAGGKIFIQAHLTFLVIMAATYTGTLGPFLVSSLPVTNTKYLGAYLGGDSTPTTPESVQFKYMEAEMQNDNSKKFQIWTTELMHSYNNNGQMQEKNRTFDPCTATNLQLGAYDMLDCSGSSDAVYKPDSLIFDAPLVYYELARRYNNTGTCSLKTIGNEFFSSNFGIGFLKDTTYARAFSMAIQVAIDNGDITRHSLSRKYRIRAQDNPCVAFSNPQLEITKDMVAGVFIFTVAGIFIALILGILQGMASGRFKLLFQAMFTCKEIPLEGEEEEEEVEEEGEEQGMDEELKRQGHDDNMEEAAGDDKKREDSVEESMKIKPSVRLGHVTLLLA